jgi:hypothetical protein
MGSETTGCDHCASFPDAEYFSCLDEDMSKKTELHVDPIESNWRLGRIFTEEYKHDGTAKLRGVVSKVLHV